MLNAEQTHSVELIGRSDRFSAGQTLRVPMELCRGGRRVLKIASQGEGWAR